MSHRDCLGRLGLTASSEQQPHTAVKGRNKLESEVGGLREVGACAGDAPAELGMWANLR